MNTQKSTGGYWMLLGLVALLMAPVGVNYIIHSSDAAQPTIHADASAPTTKAN